MSQEGERTEKATEKRLRDARRKGQVAKSQDFSSALLLIAAVAVFWVAGANMGGQLSAAMRDQLVHAGSFRGELDRAAALSAIFTGVKAMALALAPLLAVMFLAAALIGYLQVGPVFSFEPVKPNLNKLSPGESFRQKFLKSRPYIELGKTLVKIVLAVIIVGTVLWIARRDVIELTRQPAPRVASFTASLILDIGLKVGLAFLLLGVGDLFLQKFLHLKEMRMTKQEVRQEYKEMEGNPLFKNLRRQIHREILMQNILAAVRQAHVVVVNPTHLAVALRYDRETMGAPTLVAKGAELMAAKIREIATEADVPLMRDVPLAHALFELEIDQEIPEELYETVAVVLSWAYQLAEDRGEVTSHA
jgi:type III secretion YscU/HrpY family protein